MLQSMGSQRVRHNLVTEQQQQPDNVPNSKSLTLIPSANSLLLCKVRFLGPGDKDTDIFGHNSAYHSRKSTFSLNSSPSAPSGLIKFKKNWFQLLISSVQSFSQVWLFGTPWTAARQASYPSPSPGVCSNSCPLSPWCHPIISSSVIPFSSCLKSFPASESFPISQFFTSGGQSTGASASPSVLPMNFQDWLPLGWTGLISLLSMGFSRVFSNTTVQKHQFFSTQPSALSFLYDPTLTSIHDHWKNHSFD